MEGEIFKQLKCFLDLIVSERFRVLVVNCSGHLLAKPFSQVMSTGCDMLGVI